MLFSRLCSERPRQLVPDYKPHTVQPLAFARSQAHRRFRTVSSLLEWETYQLFEASKAMACRGLVWDKTVHLVFDSCRDSIWAELNFPRPVLRQISRRRLVFLSTLSPLHFTTSPLRLNWFLSVIARCSDYCALGAVCYTIAASAYIERVVYCLPISSSACFLHDS